MGRNLSIDLRPANWREVLSNEAAITAVQQKIASGSIPVAFMFVGPPGVGKTTVAKLVAKSLEASDIRELNAADLNGVQDMRNLVLDVEDSYPMIGKYRVIILDEAQQLTDPAQNCLLKPLERPGPNVWIFCTTDPQKMIPALRKRCLSFTLRLLDDQSRLTLAKRAFGQTAPPADFLKALETSGLYAPRDILMACEKFLAGIPAAEAVLDTGGVHDPLYANVAKAVLAGDWDKTAGYLQAIKTSDARGLRAVVAAFMKGELVNAEESPRADILAASIKSLVLYNGFEDGLANAATAAVLYEAAKKL